MIELPVCYDRGEEVEEGKYKCHSLSLLVHGTVTTSDCNQCTHRNTKPHVTRKSFSSHNLKKNTPQLTIGMAVYNDFPGCFFTIQALKLYQDLSNTEIIIVDNYGCDSTKRLAEESEVRYVRFTRVKGTAAPRQRIFEEAKAEAVLVCDSHVLLSPESVKSLRDFYVQHPETEDLYQGPLLQNDGRTVITQMEPSWNDKFYGRWVASTVLDPKTPPFEIQMQGLGLFSCRRESWLGFNPRFTGFGGEEGYIHEKFRRAGHRVICLPWLRWSHLFHDKTRPSYKVHLKDRLINYVIGFCELGWSLEPIINHFKAYLPADEVYKAVQQALIKTRTPL